MSWLTPAVFLAVILVSLALAYLNSELILLAALLGIVGAGGALFLWQRPALGLIGTMLGGIMVPLTLPGGLNVAILGIAAMLALWLADMVIRQQRIVLLNTRPIRPVLLFLVIAGASFLVGQLPWYYFATPAPISAQIGGLLVFVLCPGAFLLVGHQVRDERWLKWMTYSFVALAGLHISGWVIPGVGPLTNPLFQNGTVNSAMFWVWLVAMAMSQALINRDMPLFWRIVLGVLAGATLFVAFFWNRGWKSGYLPAVVAVAVIIGVRYRRLGIAMILTGYLPAWYLVTQAVSSDEYSFGTRVDALNIMLEVSKRNPILGLGPANYYWYVPLYRIRGYVSVFSSHNQYLDLLVQTGLLGLLAIFWFAAEVGWLGWRLIKRLPDGFARAYAYGAFGGLAGTLASGALADWFLPFVYNIGFDGFRSAILPWLFLGGLVSLERIYLCKAES